jgi:TonB family protein
MRKTLTLFLAAGLLAGCSHSPIAPHSLRTAARPPAQKEKALARAPLTLAIDGVHFDKLSRAAAVSALEARGFKPLRVATHFACDSFSPPRALAGASLLAVCWSQGRWAEAWLNFPQLPPTGARPRPPWHALLRALAHKFGARARFWLPHIGNRYVHWSVDGGRGEVKLTRAWPSARERLTIADSRSLHALEVSAKRQQRQRDERENPLAAQPAPSAPAPAAPAPAVLVPPQRGAGFPHPQAFYPQNAQRLGEEGTAVVRVCISAHGRVTAAHIRTSSGSTSLDSAALRYARATSGHWVPAERAGRPIADCASLPVRFSPMGGF